MNNCVRCGDSVQHNDLAVVFRVVKDKRERAVVCLKCKDIIGKDKKDFKKIETPPIV